VGEVHAPAPAPVDEVGLVERLRAGDEQAFEALVEQYYPLMIRVARSYVRTPAVAEEVVQDAWLAVLKGIDRFEGRSSLKTWVVSIVSNRAKTEGRRESRSVPLSALADEPEDVVEPERFRAQDDPFPGHWWAYPGDWRALPERRLLARETLQVIEDAIAALPQTQRLVISLRDVEGWSADEVCNALELSETNQRVLLHRARSRVRKALEGHLDG
jgi:RNA polymerase sigma-70 factor (ECF subfamily)